MSRITVLPELLINKIAAGEIIERPASILRELLDNSIDAGATRIDVEAVQGGKKLIMVRDDGEGMDRDDALRCFERHATSKISSEADLFDITTLGFRGEALPAIASIAKITLMTGREGAEGGTRVEAGMRGSKEVSDAPPIRGTTVEVRDIFYNTPARRKFLKSNPTELFHVVETVVQKALAYPQIAFFLSHGKKEIVGVHAASSQRERFAQLYGDELAGEFLEIRAGSGGMVLSGFVSRTEFTRGKRSHQVLFVNRRPVRNGTVNHAVYRAYEGRIPKERHPAYFLFLEIDPSRVDVNVHPAKREVRFETPDDIHRLVEGAVYRALNPDQPFQKGSYSADDYRRVPAGFSGVTLSRPTSSGSALPAVREDQTDFFAAGVTGDVPSFFHIGDAFVASVTNEGLVLIDQHAAHERILYEKFLRKTSIDAESLFLPLRVELPPREYGLIVGKTDMLRTFGLDVDDFGRNNVVVRGMPKELGKAEMKGLLLDIAAAIEESETSGIRDESLDEALARNVASRLACHRSVRGSEHLSGEELSRMMQDLNRTTEPDRCPHGRPTRIFLSHDELKKMFQRK